jgi:hypothetical protein
MSCDKHRVKTTELFISVIVTAIIIIIIIIIITYLLRGLSPQANYTDRATPACRLS